jgi:hypothetical protein
VVRLVPSLVPLIVAAEYLSPGTLYGGQESAGLTEDHEEEGNPTYELAQIPGPGTTGQLYHHLRERRAAGLVVQRRRSGYAVPAGRAIPCLVLVAAAQGCAHVREFAS